MLTAVWGTAYVERFLRFAMRSLMAPGNLPDLAREHEVSYHIYSTAADLELIRQDDNFKSLSRVVSFQLHAFPEGAINTGNAMSHWDVWQWGVAKAREKDAFVILIAADQVFCRGTLMRWADRLSDGSSVIFCTGFQVVAETFTRDIVARFQSDRPIDLTLPELRELTFRHLHPIIIAMFRESPRMLPHPEWHLRAVPGQGIVQRTLSSHAYAFHPNRVALTENFCPVEQSNSVVFEPSCFLGAEPLLKQLDLYLRPRRMDDVTLSYYGVWAGHYIADANLVESRIAHPMPLGESSLSKSNLRRQEQGGAFYAGQMRVSRSIALLWRAIQDAGLYQGARGLAAAHMNFRLRRRVVVAEVKTVFVPADDVLHRVTSGEVARLLNGTGSALIVALSAHVAADRHELSPGDRIRETSDGAIKCADGRRYGIDRAGSIKVLRGPIRTRDANIYVIDRPMTALELRPQQAASSLVRVQHGVRYFLRHGIKAGRSALVGFLQRNHRLYNLVLRTRERIIARWQPGLGGNSVNTAPIPPEALDFYRRAMAARGVGAMRDLLDFYQEQVLRGSVITSAPRDFLEGLGHTPPAAEWLKQAVQRYPSFCEAWLELGFLNQEADNFSDAIDAFRQAAALTPVLPHPLGQPDMRTIAAAELASLLETQGRHAEALAVLDAAPVKRFAPWRFDFLRARLMLREGRIEEALSTFEQCMNWRSANPKLTAGLPTEMGDILEAIQNRH